MPVEAVNRDIELVHQAGFSQGKVCAYEQLEQMIQDAKTKESGHLVGLRRMAFEATGRIRAEPGGRLALRVSAAVRAAVDAWRASK